MGDTGTPPGGLSGVQDTLLLI